MLHFACLHTFMSLFRPYIIDLESTNGTYVNNNRIDTARYYELKEGVSLYGNCVLLLLKI